MELQLSKSPTCQSVEQLCTAIQQRMTLRFCEDGFRFIPVAEFGKHPRHPRHSQVERRRVLIIRYRLSQHPVADGGRYCSHDPVQRMRNPATSIRYTQGIAREHLRIRWEKPILSLVVGTLQNIVDDLVKYMAECLVADRTRLGVFWLPQSGRFLDDLQYVFWGWTSRRIQTHEFLNNVRAVRRQTVIITDCRDKTLAGFGLKT